MKEEEKEGRKGGKKWREEKKEGRKEGGLKDFFYEQLSNSSK